MARRPARPAIALAALLLLVILLLALGLALALRAGVIAIEIILRLAGLLAA